MEEKEGFDRSTELLDRLICMLPEKENAKVVVTACVTLLAYVVSKCGKDPLSNLGSVCGALRAAFEGFVEEKGGSNDGGRDE